MNEYYLQILHPKLSKCARGGHLKLMPIFSTLGFKICQAMLYLPMFCSVRRHLKTNLKFNEPQNVGLKTAIDNLELKDAVWS